MSSKRRLTDKEAEILAKQRRVAVKLSSSTSASKSCNGGSLKPPPPPSNKQAALLQSKRQRQQVQQVLKGEQASKTKALPAVVPKRPTLKANSAQAALRAARAKLEASKSSGAKPQQPKASPQLQRKNINGNTKSLGNLISASVSTSNQAEEGASATYGSLEPDDFWRNLREWDLLSQYARQLSSNNTPTNSNQKPAATTKPIPDAFINHRHYIASWGPLCLAEARAQLLSEVMRRNNNKLVSVTVQTLKKSLGTALESHTLMIQSKHSPSELTFYPNDACLLVPEQYFQLAERLMSPNNSKDILPPDQDSWRYMGLVGHTDNARRSLDGLHLKVSKKWWAKLSVKVSGNKWGLLKLGANISALREFTALCRVDMIPMRKHLLCQHLESTRDAANPKRKKAPTTKAQLLNQMGGVEALGKGFTAYAQKKFNPSQLQAIAASAADYGDGGFTLIKGPPGTGKTTTLVAILNSLHIRQFNKYFENLNELAKKQSVVNNRAKLNLAVRAKPRLLVCAPSNAAVDNIILKIMEDGFVDGSGRRYNPSMIRVGSGQSSDVKAVSLESQVNAILTDHSDLGKVETSLAAYKMEMQKVTNDIFQLRKRLVAIKNASQWPLPRYWEIRVDEVTFDTTGRIYFVNHNTKTTSYECPPPPEPDETQFSYSAMPEYRSYMSKIVKKYEMYNSLCVKLERCKLIRAGLTSSSNHQMQQDLEVHVLDNVHIVLTTLGTAGNKVLEAVDKFEVVVVDEAAQSVEPSTLSALQLGSKHVILVGDPQQLPATIFNVSGRGSKYDRSLFQRLEEAGQEVFMLDQQYRMNPKISHFPREIFYGGDLKDGPNVKNPEYGNPLHNKILESVPAFQPFTILDLDSKEERGGSSYANSAEAQLAAHLYMQLRNSTNGLSAKTRVAVITPYKEQSTLLRRTFGKMLGREYDKLVDINTVDAFQGREANIVIFSCVRAAGSSGIGFLSDVRRMNVALTRAKHFLLVIARCKSIVTNPYWKDLVEHARSNDAIVDVSLSKSGNQYNFPELHELRVPGMGVTTTAKPKANDPRNPNKNDPRKNLKAAKAVAVAAPPADPRAKRPPPPPPPPRDPRGQPSTDAFLPTDPRKPKPGQDPKNGSRGYKL